VESNVWISLTVGEDVVGKLAELAGSKQKSGKFLTRLVRVLYTEQMAAQGDVRLMEILAQAHLLAERHKKNEETIRILRGRLNNLTTSQGELLALVELLSNLLSNPTSGNSIQGSRRMH
jgi:hypothetical protein